MADPAPQPVRWVSFETVVHHPLVVSASFVLHLVVFWARQRPSQILRRLGTGPRRWANNVVQFRFQRECGGSAAQHPRVVLIGHQPLVVPEKKEINRPATIETHAIALDRIRGLE